MTKDELRVEARELGFEVFGVAPAGEFPGVPTWARSVVVLGMAALDPALDLELYLEEGTQRWWSKWAYERLVAGAARLALLLTAEGRRAQPLTYEDSLAVLDLKAAAVRAGLGVRGLNTLLITRRFGPRVRLGALFTDLDLPPDRPLVDYFCVSCTLCLAACPTGALRLDGLDRSRCIAEFDPDPAMVDLQKRLCQFPTPHTRLQCAACVTSCPVGKRLPTRFWGFD